MFGPGKRGSVGIYNLHFKARGGGEKRTLVLADHLSRSCRVVLFSPELLDLAALEAYFDVNLRRVEVVVLGSREEDFARIAAMDLDRFVNNSYRSELPCPARSGVYMCMFPHPCKTTALESYRVVTANSRFTAEWIEKEWGRRSRVVYSACDAMEARPKDKVILNVGRFVADSATEHHKRQDVLVDAFRKMTWLHDAGWELHLAGTSMADEESLRYLASLRDAARGLSVYFHPDAPREVLRALYGRARVYWHAAGFGSSPEELPFRQEHFGVSIVEAMSAGAVPIVFDGGGPRETVAPGVNGYRFRDEEGLSAFTNRVVSDTALERKLAKCAVATSRKFSRAAFVRRVERALDAA
jgi:glycosyltransferase involved in cell wall biosynthesis